MHILGKKELKKPSGTLVTVFASDGGPANVAGPGKTFPLPSRQPATGLTVPFLSYWPSPKLAPDLKLGIAAIPIRSSEWRP